MPFTSSSTSRPSLPPPPGPPPTGPLPELPSEPSTRDPSPTPSDVAQPYEQHSWPTLDVASLKEKLEEVAGASDRDATEACDEDGVYDSDFEMETEDKSQHRVLTPGHSSLLIQGLEVATETEDQSQDWALTPDPRFDLAQDLAGLTLPAKGPSDKATANFPLNLQRDDSDEELDYQTASEGEGLGGSSAAKQKPSNKISDESDDEDYTQARKIYESDDIQQINLQEWTRYTKQAQPLPPVSWDGNKEFKLCYEPNDHLELMPMIQWLSKLQLGTQICAVSADINLTAKGRVKGYNLSVLSFSKSARPNRVCLSESGGYEKGEYPAELAPFVEWAKGFETQMVARSIDVTAQLGEDGEMTKFKVKMVNMRSKNEKVWIKENYN
ncbi:MAG: hypothetical protein Q9212_003981 [Teloschistes hypoglaucus]